jgi:uncharacterized lipoprotein YajG
MRVAAHSTPKAQAAMKMTPPIVGVFSLPICQVGPSSRIFWPNFSSCSRRMTGFASSMLSAKDARKTTAVKVSMLLPPDDQTSFA